MKKEHRIWYFYNQTDGMETIICQQSMISYPLHNHATVYTIGMLLDGAIKLKLENREEIYRAGELFSIPPYMPHSIQAAEPYTMISVCMKKELFSQYGAVPEMHKSEKSLEKLCKQLEESPENKLSIEDMAHSVYMSKYHMIRTFRMETGLTPHQFQMQNRIRKAQHLLLDSKKSITEVALGTGFCDQSHFIRQFEKMLGITPTEYRMSCIR